ncbi:MAG: hypothetical protein JSW60_05025, partial [Thermoplasmatales archaeon]
MKRKNILKEAGVLLIAAIMVLSTIAVTANTTNEKEEAPICLIASGNQEMIAKSTQENSDYKQSGNGPELWNNGLPDSRNGLSCVYWPANPLDREVIDNFEVTEEFWLVCDGHFRIVTYSGAGPDIIDAVRVFFYKSTGSCEPDTKRYAERDATFNAYLTGDTYFSRPEIAIDCEFDCVNLTSGEWWVCFQPEMDDNSFWLTAGGDDCSVFVYMPDLGHDKWTKGNTLDGWEDYDVSFILTGPGEPDPIPKICCRGSLDWKDRKPGETVTGTFEVCNCGDPDSLLNWQVDTWPSWGTWTFTPSSGTDLPHPNCVTVDVTVVVPDEKNANFSGEVKVINTDDPSDFCTVPVTLNTPKNKAFN